MRRDEKSDEAVVPEKQANKAAEAAAELVEGRASAKRNAEQRSAVRTQSLRYCVARVGQRAQGRKEAPKCKVHQSTTSC